MKTIILILCIGFLLTSCSSANKYGCKSNRCVKNNFAENQQKNPFT